MTSKQIYDKKHYQKNRKRKLKYCKKYREENREKICIYAKLWREKNRDKIEKYKKENRIHLLKYLKKYHQTHKKEYNNYYKNRRKKDIDYKIMTNLRIRIWSVLKGINKSKTTIKLLGCSIKYLKKHLEKQFKKDMSWDNWGRKGWHIDHIIGCYRFDLSKPNEQLQCFNYRNLRPLWASENLKRPRK